MSKRSSDTLESMDATALREAGRAPATPFRVALADGGELLVHRLLRVLPGKRIVGQGLWNGRCVLAKIFIASGSARHWAQEKAGIEALHEAGVATPDLLLAGALPAGGHVLLTRFLDGAVSLAEAWTPLASLPAGHREALAGLCPAFAMLGNLHASGLVQEDLHLGNFLRHEDRLYVIDGDAVLAITPGKPLHEDAAVPNLALLLAQLPVAWDDCREPLLEAYGKGGGACIAAGRRLEQEVKRLRAWRLQDYLGKTLRDCTLFCVSRSALRFSSVLREAREDLSALLASPDTVIRNGKLLKDGRTCTVAQVAQGERLLVVKRYNLKSFGHALMRFWRPSRAWHSWREGHRLLFFGLATPRPLALIEERIGPWRRRAFLINAFCPGDSLLQCLRADREPDAALAREIVSLFETLHRLCISHGDLKASNLLWHEGRVVLIDLDAVVQHRSAKSHARAWRRDRARLLRNWPEFSVLHQWLDKNLPAVGSD